LDLQARRAGLAWPNKAIREAYFSDTDDEACRIIGSREASPSLAPFRFRWDEAGRQLI
jgi:hypothetical protein